MIIGATADVAEGLRAGEKLEEQHAEAVHVDVALLGEHAGAQHNMRQADDRREPSTRGAEVVEPWRPWPRRATRWKP